MSKEELAKMIDNRQYGYDTFKDVIETAEENGLVILYGASDDLAEFEGAIYDEAGCFDGGDIYITKDGVSEEETENLITAIWDKDDIAWQYETDIPHATFRIMEDDEVYCIGIVFCIDDLED